MEQAMRDEVKEEVTNAVAAILSAGPASGVFDIMISGTESSVTFNQDGSFVVRVSPDDELVRGQILVKIKE